MPPPGAQMALSESASRAKAFLKPQDSTELRRTSSDASSPRAVVRRANGERGRGGLHRRRFPSTPQSPSLSTSSQARERREALEHLPQLAKDLLLGVEHRRAEAAARAAMTGFHTTAHLPVPALGHSRYGTEQGAVSGRASALPAIARGGGSSTLPNPREHATARGTVACIALGADASWGLDEALGARLSLGGAGTGDPGSRPPATRHPADPAGVERALDAVLRRNDPEAPRLVDRGLGLADLAGDVGRPAAERLHRLLFVSTASLAAGLEETLGLPAWGRVEEGSSARAVRCH